MSNCRGCGYCCLCTRCVLSLTVGLDFERTDCAFLYFEEGRFNCALAFHKPYAESLAIGEGCCSSLNSYRKGFGGNGDMKETFGNMWGSCFDGCVKVITTNGYIKRDGTAVMGRGCAKEAATKFKDLPKALGLKLAREGNRVFYFPEFDIVTFPVKHRWDEKADIDLIKKSAEELRDIATITSAYFLLPRPGCKNGELKWGDVKLVIEDILPDNVIVITNDKRF